MVTNIAYVSTVNQIPLICVSVSSLIKSNQDLLVVIHFIYSGSKKSVLVEKLNALCKALNVELKLYNLNDHLESDNDISSIYNMPPHLWRLLLPRLLDVESVLYLDTDTYICRSISGLLSTDLSKYTIAARTDFASTCGTFLNFIDDNIISETDPYLNSGVLLWNLAHSRKNNDVSQFIACVTQHWRKCFIYPYPQPDQIVLNIVFHGRWVQLDPTYNAFIREPEMDDAHILHFIGNMKPWSGRTPKRLSINYWMELLQTPFPFWRFKDFARRFIQQHIQP